MEVIFIVLMSLLPFQLLGALAYHLSYQRSPLGAKACSFFTPAVTFGLVVGAWVWWETTYRTPSGDEGLLLAIVAIFLLPLGIVANFGCSLITLLVRRNATRLPALKPLQLN